MVVLDSILRVTCTYILRRFVFGGLDREDPATPLSAILGADLGQQGTSTALGVGIRYPGHSSREG